VHFSEISQSRRSRIKKRIGHLMTKMYFPSAAGAKTLGKNKMRVGRKDLFVPPAFFGVSCASR
jgi:hypothetical protein